MEGNYQRAGLVVDANAGYGRNKRRDVLKEKVRGDGGPMNLLLWAVPAVVLPSWGWPVASCPAPTGLSQRAVLPLANAASHLNTVPQAEANPEQLDAEVQDDELRAACAKVGCRGLPAGWSSGRGLAVLTVIACITG